MEIGVYWLTVIFCKIICSKFFSISGQIFIMKHMMKPEFSEPLT